MELNLTHQTICINEVIFDSLLEQQFELDYLLPDYCESVFKVLKCKAIPKITSQRIVNGKLCIDGIVNIKVIYISEENYHIRTVNQKQLFTKNIDIKCDNPIINLCCKCDYVNCRVVSQHKLDIRGVVSIKTVISCHKKVDVISEADGMGVQLDNRCIDILGERLYTQKEFSIKEELELSAGKPPICEVIDYTASAIVTDYKLIQNKVVLKGEISFHLLYASEEKPQIMEHKIPISQVVDVMGIDDGYICLFNFDIIDIDIMLNNDISDNKYEVELLICATVDANKNEKIYLINDIYSTMREISTESKKMKIEELVGVLNESCICKNTIEIPHNELDCVYDIVCEFTNETVKCTDDGVILCGNMCISILALDCENMPIMIEKSMSCEIDINSCCCDEGTMINPCVTISGISYTMLSSDEIEVKAELLVCGNIYKHSFYNVISDIVVDEKEKERDSAVVRIYFAECGERVWDIAKRFNTSIEAIKTENNLECDTLGEKGMLLIPIIG